MPAIAAGADSALLAEWQVDEGATFKKTDPIATVETDKAMVEVEAEEDGVILRFLADAGQLVEVGAPIALSGAPGETVDDVDAALEALGVNGQTVAPDSPQPNSDATKTSGARADDEERPADRLFATPLVRRLAREADLDLHSVTGSGPNGRIVRRDVEGLLAQPAPPRVEAEAKSDTPAERVEPAPADAATTGYEDVPHTRMRTAIAARLTESKRDVPHFYVRATCRVDRLLALRSELNADAAQAGGTKVSVNDLIVKAAARAHVLVPAMNVVWTEKAIRRFDTVDIGVAVASDRGLVTPVIRDAARRSVGSVSTAMGDLAERARSGKLTQTEIEGGSFCVSNLECMAPRSSRRSSTRPSRRSWPSGLRSANPS
jgi:pyruvate dehydrogenase E2 component (dihydrolipoamide acetyltransferase)